MSEKVIEFSKEQNDIFDYAQKGVLNMIVQAVAGAGKTTTLVECVKRIDPKKKVLLLAHNKSTRDTLKERVGDRANTLIFTLHGLAWRLYTEHFDDIPDIDDEKYRKYILKNMDSIATAAYKELTASRKTMYKANVFDLINKARHNLKQSEKEIRKLATKKYGMTLVADECHFVANILKWGEEHRETVDFQDLLWLPSELGYFTKKYLADVIMLDEAQDASIAQQDVIKRCMKRETRLFAFGDDDQTINSWCGSDTDSFEHLKDANEFHRKAIELPLTTNYRCGTAIIEYAKRYTDKPIKARAGAPEGIIRHETHLSEVKDGDMILCRNIAPLMEVYRRGVENGEKMYFRGEQLGENLIMAIDSAEGDSIDEIVNSMKRRVVATWECLTRDSGADETETMVDPRIISLLDTIKTMSHLPSTVKNRKNLEKFIHEVFSDEGKEGIQLSTIHRAKGLEADNVFIICPSLIPSSLARLDWERREEQHLLYVMSTRPKNSLNFISEKEIAPDNTFSEARSLYTYLNKLRNELER